MLTLAMLNMKCMSFLMMMFIEVAVGAETEVCRSVCCRIKKQNFKKKIMGLSHPIFSFIMFSLSASNVRYIQLKKTVVDVRQNLGSVAPR